VASDESAVAACAVGLAWTLTPEFLEPELLEPELLELEDVERIRPPLSSVVATVVVVDLEPPLSSVVTTVGGVGAGVVVAVVVVVVGVDLEPPLSSAVTTVGVVGVDPDDELLEPPDELLLDDTDEDPDLLASAPDEVALATMAIMPSKAVIRE